MSEGLSITSETTSKTYFDSCFLHSNVMHVFNLILSSVTVFRVRLTLTGNSFLHGIHDICSDNNNNNDGNNNMIYFKVFMCCIDAKLLEDVLYLLSETSLVRLSSR